MSNARACDKARIREALRANIRRGAEGLTLNELPSFLGQQKRLLADEARSHLDAAARIASSPSSRHSKRQSLHQLAGVIANLRCRTFEGMNQVLHHFAVVRAAEWLLKHRAEQRLAFRDSLWRFQFRQAGGKETDIAISRGTTTIVRAEVTTSYLPQGAIDKRLGSVSQKLRRKKALRKYYFVVSPKMGHSADRKVNHRTGRGATVVPLDENSLPSLDCSHCRYQPNPKVRKPRGEVERA
jgi:hypothetical protein